MENNVLISAFLIAFETMASRNDTFRLCCFLLSRVETRRSEEQKGRQRADAGPGQWEGSRESEEMQVMQGQKQLEQALQVLQGGVRRATQATFSQGGCTKNSEWKFVLLFSRLADLLHWGVVRG